MNLSERAATLRSACRPLRNSLQNPLIAGRPPRYNYFRQDAIVFRLQFPPDFRDWGRAHKSCTSHTELTIVLEVASPGKRGADCSVSERTPERDCAPRGPVVGRATSPMSATIFLTLG